MVNPYSIFLYGHLWKSANLSAPKTHKIREPRFTSKLSEKPYFSSIFTLSFMHFGHQYHTLHMARHREHIHRLRHNSLIPMLLHKRQITCQGCRIAGNINNALRLYLGNRRQHLLLAARTRRIYNNHVRTHAACKQLRQLLSSITADKLADFQR